MAFVPPMLLSRSQIASGTVAGARPGQVKFVEWVDPTERGFSGRPQGRDGLKSAQGVAATRAAGSGHRMIDPALTT
jgi:hypothetical protein